MKSTKPNKTKKSTKPKNDKLKKPKAPLGFAKKPIVIDGNQHLVGRLAALVAKLLLQGHSITIVRCERLVYSGHTYRHKLKYLRFLHKRCNVNPARGPFHHRAPARIFRRCVRGMLPVKVGRGKWALSRLRTYEGVPERYNHIKARMVPEAMRSLCIDPNTEITQLGRLASLIGWKQNKVVGALESARLKKNSLAKRKKERKLVATRVTRTVAKKSPLPKQLKTELKKFGY